MAKYDKFPRKFDPSKAKYNDEGVFWDGEWIFTAREYDDDEVEEGCVGLLMSFYMPDLTDGIQFGDALYTGYHSLVELMEDVYTTDCWQLSPHGYDAGTVAELARYMHEIEGVDLTMLLHMTKEKENEHDN